MSAANPAQPASTGCALCGLATSSGERFCCAGCGNVYAILEESGVIASGADFRQSEIYQESLRLGLISNAQRQQAFFAIPESAERREGLYQVSGLWCASCGWLIEHALLKERGVVSAEVLFTSDLLRVIYCPQYVEEGRIQKRVSALGYAAAEYSGEGEQQDRGEMHTLLLRLGIAGALWMNVMLFSLVVYASYFESIAGWAQHAIPFVLMGLATPAIFWSGWPILRLAALGLRAGAVRMEALIATGMLAAYGYSTWQAFLAGQHLYFDTACAIVTLVLAGKALERGAKERTARSVAMLYRLMPKKARWWTEGKERFVSIDAVQPGMCILVKPGERIPADGVVAAGTSPVDEAVVTGESEPRVKSPGSSVLGGSLNGAGVLEIEVTRAANASTLAQIIRSVEHSMSTRTPLERAVDRVSRIFVPVVLAVSAATLAGGLALGLGAVEAMLRAIAVLVIACPCALGVATPLATIAAVGAASRRGILIRDARVLETIRRIDVLVLDKTGTVTEAQFGVREAQFDDPENLLRVSALEAQSEHPIAQAIVRYATPDRAAAQVTIRGGLGIAGQVDGRTVLAGSRAWMTQHGVEVPPDTRGLTTVYCAVEGRLAGTITLGDRIRPDAAALIERMRAAHVRTVLLSGDTAATTAAAARELRIDEHHGEVLPDEKAATVERYRRSGAVVAMAGDGINDAPALAAADLGIAMGGGTDLAMQAAPVVLMSTSLARIAETADLARRTHRIIRQNLFWAFFYNTAGIALAISGYLNPILAAGAMVLSSLSVIGNSLRLRGSAETPAVSTPDPS